MLFPPFLTNRLGHKSFSEDAKRAGRQVRSTLISLHDVTHHDHHGDALSFLRLQGLLLPTYLPGSATRVSAQSLRHPQAKPKTRSKTSWEVLGKNLRSLKEAAPATIRTSH